MADIEYTQYDAEGLDLIEPLWQKLNRHHRACAHRVFNGHFDSFTFEDRKKQLLEKSQSGAILVDVAADKKTGELIGYCVTTVSGEKQSEIDSIFVEKAYRRRGIGDALMKRALKWLDFHETTRRVIAVVSGNEEALPFYRRYGFHPRVSLLEQGEGTKNTGHD